MTFQNDFDTSGPSGRAAVPPDPPRRDRLLYMDHFRAFSIAAIVASHSLGYWDRSGLLDGSFVNFISGGNALFVFISGFFLHYAFSRKFDHRAFLRLRSERVLYPYAILSVAFMALHYLVFGAIPFPFEMFQSAALQDTAAVIVNLFTGRTITAYWYVPFAILLFLSSPLFLRLSRLPPGMLALVLLALFAGATVFHLPPMGLNPLHSFLYFAPFYLLGVSYGRYERALRPVLQRGMIPLALATLGVTLFMAAAGQVGYTAKWNPFSWTGPDLMVAKNILTIALLLSVFLRLNHVQSELAARIATASFAIFFIHPWIIFCLKHAGVYALTPGFLGFVAKWALTLLLSVLAAEGIRKFSGRYSRAIIGY